MKKVFCVSKEYQNYSLEEYIKKNDITDARHGGYLGFNQMTWDFGLPRQHFNNSDKIESLVSFSS